jgi:hypothetical protein
MEETISLTSLPSNFNLHNMHTVFFRLSSKLSRIVSMRNGHYNIFFLGELFSFTTLCGKSHGIIFFRNNVEWKNKKSKKKLIS